MSLPEEVEEESVPEKTLRLVAEFLEESGLTESLAALRRETGRDFPSNGRAACGALLSAVQAACDISLLSAPPPDSALCAPGDGVFARGPAPAATLCAAHRKNVLAVRASPLPAAPRALLSASTDRTVARTADFVAASESGGGGGVAWRTEVPAAAIALDWSGDGARAAAGTMGGTVHVFDAANGAELAALAPHRKYVVCVRFLGDGSGRFVSASHDRRVLLFAPDAASSSSSYGVVGEWEFAGCVEAVALLLPPGGCRVAVSVRGDNHLRVIDANNAAAAAEDLLNMNATGDDHVSFTALDLAVSRCGRFLLAATDADRLLLFDLERGGALVRTFWGAPNDGMSMPRCCFGSSTVASDAETATPKYVYASGQDNAVHVWEVATQKEVATLRGHTKTLRSLDFAVHANALVTASYDATIRVWPAAASPSEGEANFS